MIAYILQVITTGKGKAMPGTWVKCWKGSFRQKIYLIIFNEVTAPSNKNNLHPDKLSEQIWRSASQTSARPIVGYQ